MLQSHKSKQHDAYNTCLNVSSPILLQISPLYHKTENQLKACLSPSLKNEHYLPLWIWRRVEWSHCSASSATSQRPDSEDKEGTYKELQVGPELSFHLRYL